MTTRDHDTNSCACFACSPPADVSRRGFLRVSVAPDAVSRVAALPGVAWVEPYVPPTLFNDVAGGLMRVPAARDELGRWPAVAEWDENGRRPSARTFHRHFGGWRQACRAGEPSEAGGRGAAGPRRSDDESRQLK